MAPGLRSGRTGHPKVGAGGADPAGGGCGGGCSPLRRTDTGVEGRCLRTRWKAGSGGMLANCLLSVGMLVLLVRCALAAEEKSTYDASGSSSLPGDPAVTAAPAHPLADLSVAEEVPFSVVHSAVDSESEAEGLSGQPVFSSVLTVMAGTVKHPVSLVQSRTSPTITRDENHTTQWPSHSSSPSLEMSSSSSSVGVNRNLPASSGLTLNQHVTPSPQAVSMVSVVSGPSHLPLMDENRNVSVFSSSPVSSITSSSSLSSPPSTVSSSVRSIFFSLEWMHKAASSQRHTTLSKAISQTKAVTLAGPGSPNWIDSLDDSQPTAVTHRLQSVSAAPSSSVLSEIITESHTEQSNKVFYSSAVAINGASETYKNNSSMKETKTPANNTLSLNSNLEILPSRFSYGDIQTQSPATSSLLANNHGTSTSFPSNQESQVVERQQGASQNPTSVLLSFHPKGYSLSSHVTEQMLNRTTRAEDEAAVVSQTSVHKSVGKAIMSPFHSHAVNPTVTTAMFSTSESFFTISSATPPGKTSLSEAAITTPTPIHSGMRSLEHASNPDDLLMAAGHSSPRAPAININYNQGEIAGPEFTSISSQTYLNNSLFPTKPRPVQSTSGSFLSLITQAGKTSSLSVSERVHMASNRVINDPEFVTQTAIPKGFIQEGREHTTLKKIFSSHTRTVSLSSSSSTLPLKSTSLTLSPNKSDLTVSSAKTSASIKFESHDHSIPAPGVYMTERNNAVDSLHKNTAKMSVSPLFNVNEETTPFKDTAIYKKVVSSGQFTTKFPSFMTTKDILTGKTPPTKTSFSQHLLINATPEPLKSRPRKDNVTLMGRYEQSSSSSWSEINLTLRTNSTTDSQGPIVHSSSDKSHFYLGRKTTIFFSASSAAATSSSDGQHRTAIFSFGPQPLAQYTKWKTNKPVPFQTSAFKSENTSVGSDRPRSNLQTDGPSYEHPKLEEEQQSNVHILNRAHPTASATDPYSFHPSETEHYVGDYGSFTHVKDAPVSKEQSGNLSTADPRSAAAVSATLNVPASSNSPTDSVTSSKPASAALSYNSKSPISDVSSVGFVSDTAVTHNSPPSFSHTDNINNITESNLKGRPLPSELVSSPFPFPSSSLKLSSSSFSSSETALLYLRSVTTSGSSLHMKHTNSLPSQASSVLSISPPPSSSSSSSSSSPPSPSSSSTVNLDGSVLSTNPTGYPGTASSSVSLKKTSPKSSPLSPSLTPSVDSGASHRVTETFVVLTETATDELTAGTNREVAFPKEKEAGLAPSQSVRTTLFAGPTERTPQVSPLTPRPDTTTASVKLTTTTSALNTKPKSPNTTTPSLGVTTGTKQTTTTTTLQPTTRRTTTTITTRTQTSRRTVSPSVMRTSPPRAATTHFISPFTTTTESPPQQCNITERMWVRTVVSIYVRRNRLDSIQRQNLRRGLSQGLRKALNDSFAQAQVETVFGSPNMTVAYHVTGADMVYPPSVVQEGLNSYGRDKLIADLRQYLPMVTALPLAVALWRSSPATGFQLKTVLQFVGAGDDPRSCRFSQMMEQRLEKVFSEAQAKVFNTNSKLAVQMLSVSQAAGSPAVSLVYSVKNGTVFLNGTTASNLLGQLSAELVGYFLFYPPLIIAEPMEYHNLNTSVGTRDFWVITVIQDVDNTSLEGQYQSFASLMEQRLAELFVLASQQGTRFRRATTVGSYTVQMVSIRRVSGLKNPAEMTYYVQHNGVPLSGTSAAKVLNTVDSQTMALTLGYFVQLQAEPVVKNPPNNLWIIAAVLAPIAVVTLIIIIITAVLCRKNKNDFKADAIGNLNPRAKMAYRRDVGYYHQPVQGFDYAKQHLGQQGGDEETLPVSQDTLVMSLQIRDTPLSLEKALQQDGTANKKSLTSDKHKSKLPSEDGSVISNESEKLNSGRGLTAPKVTAQQKLTKEESRKRDDPYDTSSGSLQLISIKPMVAQPNYSHPASSDRSQDSAIVNGEVNMALKQKSDIEHYRNKLRLKAKRKGYYDFPSTDGSSSGRALSQRQRHSHERAAGEHGRPLEPDDERGSTYVKSHRRHSQVGQTAYRSRQSLSSPSPGGTEMDLLVMRERPRRGIRNSGYDTEPELIEETNVDRLIGPRGYMYGRGLKGHSETSTLSSQPSIDEVRQQMHLLLEEAFSLASGGQSTSGRQSHHHHHQPPPGHYSPAPPPLPYADVVTSAPGTMSCGRGGLQWVPSYGADVYQCSLPKPAFRFTQLPEMAMGSPPPLPPRTGPPPGTSLRRSTSDLGPKGRSSETSVTGMQSQHENNPYGPTTRAALPSITAEQPVSNYSGNPITAVYAIPASRSGYSEYFVSTPPTSYHSPSWMSYPPEPEDVPPQWADSVPLPGYVEAFPHPRYPQGSPMRLPLQYNQALEQPPSAPSTASQQSLPQVVKDMDSMPLSSLSTSALVQAIRQEVAKLAKKQNDIFEF